MAQEICDNGIDDDGDGFVDCYDSDCGGNTACNGFYVSDPAGNCPPVAINLADYSVQEEWRTDTNEIYVWDAGNLLTGDINSDGVVEIFTTRWVFLDNVDVADTANQTIIVISGSDGSLITEIDAGGYVAPFMAMADVEQDGCGELFFVRKIDANGNDFEVVAVDCNWNEVWASELDGTNASTGSEQIGTMWVADFDGNGVPEVGVKAEVYNAVTGAYIGEARDGGPANSASILMGPVIGDFLPDAACASCDNLEIILGGYAVGYDPITDNANSPNDFAADYEWANQFLTSGGGGNPGNGHSASMADVDLDNDLDIIITGHIDSGPNKNTGFMYYWDVQDETEFFEVTFSSSDWGPGRAAIGNLDTDPELEIVFTHKDSLLAYDVDVAGGQFVRLWGKKLQASNTLATPTLFDFSGDGAYEVVFRDEQYIYILDGSNGTELYSVADECYTNTFAEAPVIADVDGDGDPEILVSCIDACATPGNCAPDRNKAHIRAYGATPGNQWVSARKVWNQHGYSNTHVNDDLTIPIDFQDHSLEWGTTLCDGTAGSLRPLNNFLAQAPYLTTDGCPSNPQPDLSVVDLVIDTLPTCPDTDITVSMYIYNAGDLSVSGAIPVSFYNGDPELASSEWLFTDTVAMNIAVGDTLAFQFTLTGDGSTFDLYGVANDNGTALPGINYPTTATYPECQDNNNITSVTVVPNPFTLTALTVSDNLKCTDSLNGVYLPDNGQVSAYVLASDSVTQVTAGYSFYWFNDSLPSGVADYTGANYTGLPEGNYSVYAENTAAGCLSDTVSLVVQRLTNDTTLSARIDEVAVNSSCDNPNGQLQVIVNPVDNNDSVGDSPALFSFRWEQSTIAFQGSAISSTEFANNISSGLPYLVTVTDNSTGCTVIENLDSTGSAIVYPVGQIDFTTNNNYCVGGNGSAQVSVGGDTTNFNFEWFDTEWKPAADYTSARRENMVGDVYYIIASSNSTGCADSLSFTITDSLVYPVLTLYENIGNSSCDLTNPNGQLVVVVTEDSLMSAFDLISGSTDNFTTAGSASVSATNRFQLTPNANDEAGAAWFNNKVSLAEDFSFEFLMNLGTRNAGGADGIAFTFHNDPDGRYAFGDVGQGIGAQNIDPGLAIEFDTYDNGAGFGDISDDHVAVLNTTDYSNPLFGPTTMDGAASNFEDGVDHTVVISWDASTMNLIVTIDGSQRVNETYDIVSNIFGGDPYVFFGFTSSTGGSRNLQEVELVDITATMQQSDPTTALSWYDGANTTTSLNGGTFDGDTLASGLIDGTYRVQATSTVTGCSVEEDYVVEDATVIPTINTALVTITPNSNCDSTIATGALSVAGNAVTPEPDAVDNFTYTYEWWIGNNAVGTADYTGQTITGLYDGTYTLVVTNDSTSCPSAEATFVVGDSKEYPLVTFTDSTYQTSCDATLPNATAVGTGDMGAGTEPAAGYTYAFYSGQTTNAANLIVNDSAISGQAAGIYTLYALNNDTGCEGTAEITLTDSLDARLNIDLLPPLLYCLP